MSAPMSERGERDVLARLETVLELQKVGPVFCNPDVLRDAARELRAARAERDAITSIAQDQQRHWASLTDAMSREFRDEPESEPGANVATCAIAMIRRMRAEIITLRAKLDAGVRGKAVHHGENQYTLLPESVCGREALLIFTDDNEGER